MGHDAETWTPVFGIMLDFLESITLMRMDRLDQNAS